MNDPRKKSNRPQKVHSIEWIDENKIKNIVFDSSITANSIADISGTIVDCNQTFVKLWGYKSKKDVIGKKIPYFFKDPEIAQDIISSLNEFGSWQGEWEAKRKDGTFFTASTQATNLVDKTDKILGYQSTIFDTTEMTKIKHELKEKEYLLNKSQRDANLGSYKYNLKTDVWESSQTLDKIFGLDKRSKKNMQTWLNSIHPDDRVMMDQYLRNVIIIQKLSFSKEYRIVNRKTKKTLWVHDLGDITLNKSGEIETLMGTVQDITEIKIHRERAQHNLVKFKDLIETTNSAFIVLSMDGHITEVNNIFTEILRCPKDDLLNKSIFDLLSQADSVKTEKGIKLMDKGIPIEDLEVCINNKLCGNRGVWLRINANIMENGEKNIMCLIQDITTKKTEEFKKYIAGQKQKDRVRQNISRIRTKIQDMKQLKPEKLRD